MSSIDSDSDRPVDWLLAHRGWPGRYPENSRAGVAAVIEAGARRVEFDVQLSADRQPVVIHDDHLGRVSGRRGRVGSLSLAELEKTSIGEPERFGDRFAGECLPSLESMLELTSRTPKVQLFVELKRASLRRFGREAMVEPLLGALSRVPNPVVVISFDRRVLEMVRSRSGLPIGWVFKPWNESAQVEAGRLQPEYLFVRQDRVPAGPAPFWPGDWQWVVYGVETAATAREFRQRGTDVIETDYLPELATAISGEDKGS
ncbi:glycerophosphodiester phosphodiesterase family protein [Gammaproteobacteria bacterium AB-CW1]|uniref:Glycerophosphodiester phosphodiesterase family protein n=1 Tax=Natronospira elongata TaxID=3110268 RepID=A0AAP6JIK7_9GAMM|nr:glycerophosphodiester phosphodiesterase family protein [Gammaproteobacteria bacterium AB-CW1]